MQNLSEVNQRLEAENQHLKSKLSDVRFNLVLLMVIIVTAILMASSVVFHLF